MLLNKQHDKDEYAKTCSDRCKKVLAFCESDKFRRSITVATATASCGLVMVTVE